MRPEDPHVLRVSGRSRVTFFINKTPGREVEVTVAGDGPGSAKIVLDPGVVAREGFDHAMGISLTNGRSEISENFDEYAPGWFDLLRHLWKEGEIEKRAK
jgi:hypothetical protein